jgi:CheY-like chemotaxis protein
LISKFNKNKPTILIVDDSKGIVSIVEDYIQEEIDVTEYNILTFFGDYAPFVMKETLDKLNTVHGLNKIDYAIIDIVLPGKFKENDQLVRIDGVDVAIYINGQFNCTNFVFYTGNILNAYIEFIEAKVMKFKEYFGESLKDYMILKISSEEKTKEKFTRLFKNYYVANRTK